MKIVLLVILLGLSTAGFIWYHARSTRAQSTPDYTTATVSRGDIMQEVTATGQIDAVLSVDVGSQVSGLITKLYVDYNSKVKQGDKVAELDPSTYQQALLQAEANLASSQAAYALAEINAKRTEDLYAKALVTHQDNDQAQAQLQQAKAQLMISQANVENAKVNLSRCTIYSPIDGIVISKQTEVGKTVAASLNVPTLFTIDNDLSHMQITAAVAEADIGAVAEGQQASFTVDAFPNRKFSGTITQVRNAPQNTNNVITYQTMIGVDNRDLKLRPGMTANVAITVAQRLKTLKVPNAALRVRIPEGLAVNRPAASAAPAGGAAANSGPAAGATPPPAGGGGGRGFFGENATPEQRQKMREIMAEVGFSWGSGPPTPEQRAQMRKLMLERGLITPEQAAAAAARAAGNEPVYVTRTVYRLPGGNRAATPEAVTVKAGITDGLMTEIADGLAEGDVVITSVSLPSANSAAPANPFGGPRRF